MVKKQFMTAAGKSMQQFAHRRLRFYLANFEQNILFGPFQLHELLSYCEI